MEMQKARTPMAFGGAPAARKKVSTNLFARKAMRMSAPAISSYQAAMPEVPMEPSAAPPPLFAETGVQQQITSLDQTQQMATDANASVDITADAREGTGETGGSEPSSTQIDFTLIPKMLDDSMEKYDPDNALRSTIIKTSASWTRKRKASLLTKAESSVLTSSEIKTEKDKAFDLLDALSRSGSLSIDCSSLHVLVCVTHCFENDVMGTVIQDNVNPIEKMERSTLLIGSAIHGVPAHNLVTDAGGNLNRLRSSFPLLLSDGVTRT
uniref:Uncharacterized protein n=1 Tax=Craspedostauros australis TaxID=1486917 RepID=A0A7R9ZNR5_9STRA